jgi:benzodiazapine receptor
MGTMKNLLGLAGWLLITFAAAWIGSRYMPGAWYESLVKPSWNPPNAIFAPVWSILYILMGVAAWMVWRRSGFSAAGAALAIFIIQLFLNTLWSYLFFGLHRPDMAFFDIVALWVAVLFVMMLFWREDKYAGALMLPYLAWVSFASYLNFTLWRLN